ncbi:gibberellin 2-beta-dioxygenase 8 [Hevea brasiliensis]|uniref:gibberellin 2-beta-dioxygenase 8 n=1 Tax=Hevea brasiliensis TaxID=3981 RepID=UPI000B77CBA2|nr:gibberellin 2-beta-dioxygenase 8 [Hevea brasiliensis]XP_057992797.1 gibberellin 2-beta-dioxygenase 8 [Hevea brasiliensis]XP_057992798.1 gibberellin 2-beta-dioxygenase 8 [Hevea brasiliensis]XP_057992799.1 gibberellin 2-beta-dioxygenase 8 [Hevea brasiliensis]XP_057992800.1 gibberellin 2-beta-dioxygenase 8 [Hevea brasiliensis]
MGKIDPPFQETYKTLFKDCLVRATEGRNLPMVEECELPLIDINRLSWGHPEREKCITEMAEAASKWGFFQVINHGIPVEILERMQYEQMKVFHTSFQNKCEGNILNLSANRYLWGNPKATCLRQFSWSEAFHIPLADISRMGSENRSLRSTIEAFVQTAATLAQSIAEILAENLGVKSKFFAKYCTPSTSYLRMNRYPPCPFSSEVYGLLPHTDSDFLTILYQDQIGGLQLMKDGRWVGVRPNNNPEALVINIGDLFQAFSNNIYRSVEHRVIAQQEIERFSVAYFFCPSYDAVIESFSKPAIYRKFSFREYKQQIQKDLLATGDKIGLSRFLV